MGLPGHEIRDREDHTGYLVYIFLAFMLACKPVKAGPWTTVFSTLKRLLGIIAQPPTRKIIRNNSLIHETAPSHGR